MNKLPVEKRVQILSMLVEGSSLRSISRVAGVSINTVTKLVVDAGMACATYHDETVRNVKAKRVQCDEIWSFTYTKAKGVKTAKAAPDNAGDMSWTALDSDTKLMISWWVGGRDAQTGYQFLTDLRSLRLTDRVQLTSDGLPAYLQAVPAAFGDDVDFAQLVKIYRASPASFKGRYSPG